MNRKLYVHYGVLALMLVLGFVAVMTPVVVQGQIARGQLDCEFINSAREYEVALYVLQEAGLDYEEALEALVHCTLGPIPQSTPEGGVLPTPMNYTPMSEQEMVEWLNTIEIPTTPEN